MLPQPLAQSRSSARLYLCTVILGSAAIFLVDTFAPINIAIAVLYGVIVLIAANVLNRQGVLTVAAVCAVLTILSHLSVHGVADDPDAIGALLRSLVGLSAIALTAFLVLKSQRDTRALREQATLLDLAQDAIFICDMSDVITYWNGGAEELYGWDRPSAVGKKAARLLQTKYPTPLDKITEELHRTGQWRGEMIHIRRDGSEIILDSRWLLHRDETGRPIAIMKTYNDITERKQADLKIRRAERELRQAIETIPAMVWSAAPDDDSIAFIGRGEAAAGLNVVDPQLNNVRARVHPDDLAGLELTWQRAHTATLPFEATCRVRGSDGSYRWLLIRAAPARDDSGQIVRWYGVNNDIEDRRRAEDPLHQARSELLHVARVPTLG